MRETEGDRLRPVMLGLAELQELVFDQQFVANSTGARQEEIDIRLIRLQQVRMHLTTVFHAIGIQPKVAGDQPGHIAVFVLQIGAGTSAASQAV